jgi:hypothetical protein
VRLPPSQDQELTTNGFLVAFGSKPAVEARVRVVRSTLES